MGAGNRPVYEDNLHLLDNNSTGDYTLYYASMDTIGPAVQQIDPVAPNPRNVPVDSIEITFSEALMAGSFGRDDLHLNRNGSPNLIDNTVTVAILSPTQYGVWGWRIFTQSDGNYVLSIDTAGIEDLAGNTGTDTATVSWFMDTVPPISQVNPLARRQSSLTFPISVTGFDPEPGSGILEFDVYVSTNGGPFGLWQTLPASNPMAMFTVN